MNQKQFQEHRGPAWQKLERLLLSLEKAKKTQGAHLPALPIDKQELPDLFRKTCHDLSLSQERHYSAGLCQKLNHLIIRSYRQLQRKTHSLPITILRLLIADFPRALRAEAKLFWLCMAVFWLPFIALVLSSYHDTRWIYSILGNEAMFSLDSMYSGDSPIEHLRETYGSNFMMFCFYVYNNTSIGFRTFAGGMLAGIGSLFFLLFNGLYIGAATGYIHAAGYTENFYSFVAGHSAPELIGIVISGVAGMRLGLSWLCPGNLSRKTSLIRGVKKSLPILFGAAFLIVFAAVIEGFWSPLRYPAHVKYSVGLTLWALLILYLLLAGRSFKKT